ncbi:MAG TPA: hypothetical protein VGJ02_07840, partial [Pyrinomonadaceae bacterium]
MNEASNNPGAAVTAQNDALPIEVLPNVNGDGSMVRTKDLDIAKLVTNEQRIEEEKFLEGKESQIES